MIRHLQVKEFVDDNEILKGFPLLVEINCKRNRALDGARPPLARHPLGFGSADRMRIVFSTRLGVTPVQYRASFRPAESD